jgi:hypothetical protein
MSSELESLTVILADYILDTADQIERVITSKYADMEDMRGDLEGILGDMDSFIEIHYVKYEPVDGETETEAEVEE